MGEAITPTENCRRLEAFVLFVLFVQEGPDRRSSGFTEECRTSLLRFQPRAVYYSVECPSQQQSVQSAFSQAGNPSLSASNTIYRVKTRTLY